MVDSKEQGAFDILIKTDAKSPIELEQYVSEGSAKLSTSLA